MNLLLTIVDSLVLLVVLLTTFEALRQVHSFRELPEALAQALMCWGAFVGILYASHIPQVWVVVFHSGVAMQSSLRYYHRYRRSHASAKPNRVVSIHSAQVAARQNQRAL